MPQTAPAAPLRAAVIGTGAISREHLSFLADAPGAELAAVCDLSPVAGRYAAGRYGAERSFTDHRAMLDEARPDVVHVLTPPHTHEAIVDDCLVAGAHVVCEKPVALGHDGFTRLWKRSEEVGRHLIEDQNYRFNDTILAMSELVVGGALGEVHEVDVRFALDLHGDPRLSDRNVVSPLHRLPGGALHDYLPHLCYLLLTFAPHLGFDRVWAHWANTAPDSAFTYDELDAVVVSDAVHGRLRFAGRTRPEALTVTVRGSRGSAETDLFQPYLRCIVPRPGGAKLTPLVNQAVNGWGLLASSGTNLRRKVMQRTPYEGMQRLLAATYAALAAGEAPPVGFAEMDSASRLADALLAQAGPS